IKRYLGEVHRAAQQGAVLTNRLRLFARRPAPSGQTTAPGKVLAGLRKRAEGWGPEVELRLDVPDDLPPVALTAESVHDVLAELLDNAREAIEQKGRVTVTARLAWLSPADRL